MTDSRQIESWTWYGVASTIVLLRYISRAIRLGGWRFYELEDYVMIITFGFYTNFLVWVTIQEKHPRTNILPPTGLKGITPDEIQDRIYGAKATFVLEESMIMTQFLTKLCMCLLFYKLTSGLKRQLQVKLVLGYVVVGWLVTEIFFFGIWCRPFMNYFRVEEGLNPQCATSQHHLIMSFAFNLSSDLLLLSIPIPMLLQSHLPLRQKITITGVFSLGIFVIIAAVLNRYYCFAHPESIFWIYWYIREASTAVIVSNLPHLYSLLRRLFDIDGLQSLVKSPKNSKYLKHLYPDTDSVELKKKSNGSSRGTKSKSLGPSESTENLSRPHPPLKIWQQSEYSVDDHDASEVQWDEADLRSVWRGGLGTKATIVSTGSRPGDD